MHKRQILSQFGAFERAEPRIQREMLHTGAPVRLRAGTTVIGEGDEVEQFAMVGAGRIRVFKVGGSGREITLYHVGPGQICLLTVACVLGRHPCPATATVEEEVHAVVYPADRLRHWVEESPVIRELIFGLFTSRLAHVMALINEVVFRRVDERLTEFLKQRFRPSDDGRAVLRVTHEEIAAELGSAREVVSRLLKDLERRGAIELGRGRIALVDAARM